MRFNAQEDIALDAETVFAALSDFDGFAQKAAFHGVQTIWQDRTCGAGMRWLLRGIFRGKPREIACRMTGYQPPDAMVIEAEAAGFLAILDLSVVPMSRQTARLIAVTEIRARSLGARIALHSARLGRAALARKYQARVKTFARRIADRGIADSSRTG